jgi:predicted nucleic acid-binding protein
VYDATYVALAALTASPLITGDAKLIRQMDGAYPVLWLGDFSLPQ